MVVDETDFLFIQFSRLPLFLLCVVMYFIRRHTKSINCRVLREIKVLQFPSSLLNCRLNTNIHCWHVKRLSCKFHGTYCLKYKCVQEMKWNLFMLCWRNWNCHIRVWIGMGFIENIFKINSWNLNKKYTNTTWRARLNLFQHFLTSYIRIIVLPFRKTE